MKGLGSLICGWSLFLASAASGVAMDLPNPKSIEVFENNPNAEYSTGDRYFRLGRDSFCHFLAAAIVLDRPSNSTPASTTDDAKTGKILCEGAFVADKEIFFWRVLNETTIEVTNQRGQGVILFNRKGIALEWWEVPILEYSRSPLLSRPFVSVPWQSFLPESPVMLPVPSGLVEGILNDGRSLSQSEYYSASPARLDAPLGLSESARKILELSIKKAEMQGEKFVPERDIRYLGVLHSKPEELLFWRILSPTRLMLWNRDNRFVVYSSGRVTGH